MFGFGTKVKPKEIKKMGDEFFALLDKTAKQTGYKVEQSWNGNAYRINVIVPQKVRDLFGCSESLLKIDMDTKRMNASLHSNGKVPVTKKIGYVDGFRAGVLEGVNNAIKSMELLAPYSL